MVLLATYQCQSFWYSFYYSHHTSRRRTHCPKLIFCNSSVTHTIGDVAGSKRHQRQPKCAGKNQLHMRCTCAVTKSAGKKGAACACLCVGGVNALTRTQTRTWCRRMETHNAEMLQVRFVFVCCCHGAMIFTRARWWRLDPATSPILNLSIKKP